MFTRVTKLQYQPMAWEKRLKIARQIAHAISYLHTAFHRPVIHMTIDMYSILLDEHDVPKLANFLISVSIPKGETDVEAYEGIRNTRNCTAEFRASGKVTENTDVYKFGGLLLELFTGEDSDVITQLPIYKRLVAYPAQGSCINEIVDPAIMADGKDSASLQRQLQAVLDLVLICTKEDPQRRPSMVDVTKELRQIERAFGKFEDIKLHERFQMSLWKSIVIPPVHVLNDQITKEQFILMAAIIMDYIWRLQNQVMLENKKINFQAIPFEIFQQLEEHASASFKRNVSSAESQAVNKASRRPPNA
ncbi:hypothetical protein SO802_014340 [Lithocarpus litseifolius]|uniref:Protein kinase domain-containing protein n=1 Tax=Lithocarpus litseifolius TaxID=425828 RepID=A0AAW2CRV8_9ROSI